MSVDKAPGIPILPAGSTESNNDEGMVLFFVPESAKQKFNCVGCPKLDGNVKPCQAQGCTKCYIPNAWKGQYLADAKYLLFAVP